MQIIEIFYLVLCKIPQVSLYVSYTPDIFMQNEDKTVQGIFVHNNDAKELVVTASVHWVTTGRHFKLENCRKDETEEVCLVWAESHPSNW